MVVWLYRLLNSSLLRTLPDNQSQSRTQTIHLVHYVLLQKPIRRRMKNRGRTSWKFVFVVKLKGVQDRNWIKSLYICGKMLMWQDLFNVPWLHTVT